MSQPGRQTCQMTREKTSKLVSKRITSKNLNTAPIAGLGRGRYMVNRGRGNTWKIKQIQNIAWTVFIFFSNAAPVYPRRFRRRGRSRRAASCALGITKESFRGTDGQKMLTRGTKIAGIRTRLENMDTATLSWIWVNRRWRSSMAIVNFVNAEPNVRFRRCWDSFYSGTALFPSFPNFTLHCSHEGPHISRVFVATINDAHRLLGRVW